MSNWQIASIGEICEITGGNSAPQGTVPYDGGITPFVRMRDLGRYHFTSNLNKTDDKLTEDAIQKYRMKIFEPGCILFPRSGSVFLNHRAILGTRACIVSHIGVMQNFSESINVQFLYYFLQTYDMTRLSKKTTGVDSIAFSDVARIKVPIPPLPEQERIVRLLDEAATLRKLRGQVSTRMDDFVPALFHEMFGDPKLNKHSWETRKLKDLIADGDKVNYGVVQPGDDVADGVPIVRVGDFMNMEISLEKIKRIEPSIEENYKRSRLRGDEILIACVGSIGGIALADERLKNFNIVRAVARVRPNDKLDRQFLAHYFKTPFVQDYFTNSTRTVTQPTLNIKQIEETMIMLPPLDLQREFARRVQEAREVQSAQRRSEAKIEALYQSMLSRAFAGEL